MNPNANVKKWGGVNSLGGMAETGMWGDRIALWRTPSSREAGVSVDRLIPIDGGAPGGMNRHFDAITGRMAQIGLIQQVKLREMYPTPTTQEIEQDDISITESGRRKSKSSNTSHSMNLADTVKILPTPRSKSGVSRKPGNGAKCLQEEDRKLDGWYDGGGVANDGMFPTPKSFMYKDSTTDRGKCNLGEVVGGKLNPTWVEWLMGWPLGWTSLEPLEMSGYNNWHNESDSHTWWDSEPVDVPRVCSATKYRNKRLQAIGNGQVPLSAKLAWDTLITMLDSLI